MDYEELLKRAKKELPNSAKETSRFEIPLVRGHIQGNRTIISNFNQIAAALRREPEHLLKYVLKELATPGEIKKKGVIFGRKVSASMINEKIQQYAKDFVICKECKRPDTKLVKEERVLFIRCLACGARHPVKTKL
ncbi:translation initiation factor IF-2 subunit beta [Candidatus Woesearchaeota archaeon RBG_13_36_6]|nr:MAG: translation initiation factor IF-2 subunit beta [Candidatus Woesearchaeota archaeon RBG_13_36_6]